MVKFKFFCFSNILCLYWAKNIYLGNLFDGEMYVAKLFMVVKFGRIRLNEFGDIEERIYIRLCLCVCSGTIRGWDGACMGNVVLRVKF